MTYPVFADSIVRPGCLKKPELREFQDACENELIRLGEKDTRMVVLSVGISGEARTALFAKRYPNRFFRFDSTEETMLGAAVGMAAIASTALNQCSSSLPGIASTIMARSPCRITSARSCTDWLR